MVEAAGGEMESVEVVGRVGDQVIVGVRDEASLYHRVLSRLEQPGSSRLR